MWNASVSALGHRSLHARDARDKRMEVEESGYVVGDGHATGADDLKTCPRRTRVMYLPYVRTSCSESWAARSELSHRNTFFLGLEQRTSEVQ